MLKGFPKATITEKLGRGHYRISRDDGYSIEVRSSGRGDWYQVSNMARRKSLGVFQFDMERGYMPHDQLADEITATHEKYGD